MEKTTSTKSQNSDIANSPSDTMKSKIINHIRAGFPDLYPAPKSKCKVDFLPSAGPPALSGNTKTSN